MVDESLFKVLFPEGKKSGRPTASVRVIVCMSWLKVGFGGSNEELFEKCEFDLLTRKALGLELISDAPPSLDTFFLSRRRLCDYAAGMIRAGHEQFDLGFEHSWKKSIRMDSKFIGTNSARQSRYELVHTTLVK